jgi:hypothetical protein
LTSKHGEKREQSALQSLFNAIAGQPTPEQSQRALSWIKRFGFETIQAGRQEHKEDVCERLQELGVTVTVNSYEHTLIYGAYQVKGPVFDLVLLEFVARLLRAN